jgi:hypothetical protein
MTLQINRREFVRNTTLTTAALATADIRRLVAAPGDIQFGYAAITWQGQDRQAIEDVSAVGFKGIQLRTSALPEFGDKPAALNEVKFRGWAIVELDAVPDKARSPKDSAVIARQYLESLGFTV